MLSYSSLSAKATKTLPTIPKAQEPISPAGGGRSKANGAAS